MTTAPVEFETAPRDGDIVALVGAPNTGKTTLFNALTGSRAKVGNYSGVTVERREGKIQKINNAVRLIDLPGTYSLNPETLDEQVVEDMLSGRLDGERKPDAILIVADATTLERGLGLVLQVLGAHPDSPVALVVTMIDELRARGGRINFDKLARKLGITVFPIVGNRGVGMDVLLRALEAPREWSSGSAIEIASTPLNVSFKLMRFGARSNRNLFTATNVPIASTASYFTRYGVASSS